MMHYFIGDLGHLFVIASFVTALVSAFAYWKSFHAPIEAKESWAKNARISFYAHSAAIIGVVACLFVIIYQHYFEYHYAYSHSSLHLPGQYMVSCFWEGQEGSFLLWLFWQAILGIILINTQKSWEAP
jgi:Cytochrome c biogenesis factor